MTVVSHTLFDRTALAQAFSRYDMPPLANPWADSSRVARHAWSQFAARGYGLKNLARHLGIEFRHHDALQDARAAGEVVVRARDELGLSFEELFELAERPIVVDETVAGEVVVFTGRLSMKRKEAEAMAVAAGLLVDSKVNKRTTILVCGDQDVGRLAGKEKSKKQLTAERLIAKGEDVRIVKESDFLALLEDRRSG